jgi:hypothetical protein
MSSGFLHFSGIERKSVVAHQNFSASCSWRAKEEEINQVFLLSRVMYKAILGLHYKRQEQKKNGQLAIF